MTKKLVGKRVIEVATTDIEAQQIAAVEAWLDHVVIGLNLCPFAAKPRRNKQIRIQVCGCEGELELLEALQAELTLIDEHPVTSETEGSAGAALIETTQVETTLLVIPNMLLDFDVYNQFLDKVDALLESFSWVGEYQVASFHPQYCFGGVAADSAENLTNRSPYPLLHIIREASIETALAHYANPELIPERNIETVSQLSEDEKKHMFAYLF